ncbi:MAG: zf-HC2 domain-containing protein, partial [Myxococcota bacterium]
MNCEQCESQLLSFLEEELPPDEAERARVHVAGCESCRSSLERLRTGQRLAARMPLESPDPDLDARVLEAARARAAERATTTAEASAPVEERPAETPDRANEDGGTFIDWLRGLTLGPQAAMATVMLLVVAIGLWYLPDLRKRPGAAGETVLHPEAGGEVAPTAEVEEPAEDPAPQQAPAAVED